MNGQINQITAETHLNSLFYGLDMVLPTPCQNKKCDFRREDRGAGQKSLAILTIIQSNSLRDLACMFFTDIYPIFNLR